MSIFGMSIFGMSIFGMSIFGMGRVLMTFPMPLVMVLSVLQVEPFGFVKGMFLAPGKGETQ